MTKQKAYKFLAALGILSPKLKRPEDLFFIGVPMNAGSYDLYATAIVKRTKKMHGIIHKPKTKADFHRKYEQDLLAILSVNAIAFSFDHKLPPKIEKQLTDYLVQLWGRSGLAKLLQKIDDIDPKYRADLSHVLFSNIMTFDRGEFMRKMTRRNSKFSKKLNTANNMYEILECGAKELNTARRLYSYLYEAARWKEEKNRKVVSLNKKISEDEEGEPLYIEDILPGETSEDILDGINKKIEIARIHSLMNSLPHAEKDAVEKMLKCEKLTPTQRRARDRGIKKIKGWIADKK